MHLCGTEQDSLMNNTFEHIDAIVNRGCFEVTPTGVRKERDFDY